MLQEQLRQIGIEAELNLVENGAMVDQVYERKIFDIAVTGESAYVDPNTLILPNFKSGEAGNFVSYSNPKADELIERGSRSAIRRNGPRSIRICSRSCWRICRGSTSSSPTSTKR